MKKNVKNFIKVFLSNALLVALGILQSFLLPNILGPAEYGQWSLYLLYTGYAGFFSFGFCDGILLVFGGKDYSQLDGKRFKGYFVTHFLFLVSLFLIFLSVLIIANVDNLLLYVFIGVACVFSCQRDFFEAINVSTNRMTQYSIGHILEKVFILLGILFCLVFSIKNSIFVVSFAVSGWFVTVLYNIFACRRLLSFNVSFRILEDKKDYWMLCARGIFITFASVGVSLMTGVGKMFVSWRLGDTQLGYYSFVFSTSALFAVFFNAISTVLYPLFKEKEAKQSIEFFSNYNFLIAVFGVVLLLAYFPLYWLFLNFFPKYTESLGCLFVLIPLVIVQGKNNSVYITLYKIHNLEKYLALNLLISVAACCGITILAYTIYPSIISVALGTYVSLMLLLFLNHFVFNHKMKANDEKIRIFWIDLVAHAAFMTINVIFPFGLKALALSSIVVFVFAILYFRRTRILLGSIFGSLKERRTEKHDNNI